MKYNILTLILCLLFSFGAEAKKLENKENKGFRIEIDAPHKQGSTIYLARYWNGNIYAQDSLQISAQGKALFFSPEKLSAGQYLIYIKPDIKLDLLIDKQQSDISIIINENDLLKSSITGNKDTELLWQHMAYLSEKRVEKDVLEKQLSEPNVSQEKRSSTEEKIKALDENVASHTQLLIKANNQTWFATFIKGMEPITLPYPSPQTQGEMEENRVYGKVHFFDNIDLTDPRFWHTTYFTNYIDTYMQEWVEPIPDSLAMASSRLVAKTKGNDFCFKEMLSTLTNQSIQSPLMGMESVWAKLAEDYIFDKNIEWIDSTQLSELKRGYAALKHNRIGMKGHDLTLQTMDGQTFKTGNIAANYLILYFYDTNCAHCQKQAPVLHNELYAKYKDEGVKILAINIGNNAEEWEKFVTNNKLTNWINCADPNYKSEYWMYYDTTSIPSLFVLDKDKKIVAKKIDEQSLDKFFEFYTRNKNGIN